MVYETEINVAKKNHSRLDFKCQFYKSQLHITNTTSMTIKKLVLILNDIFIPYPGGQKRPP